MNRGAYLLFAGLIIASCSNEPGWGEQQAIANIQQGKAFLEENRHQQGIISLPSGLQYRILRTGTGPKPEIKDVIEVHYRGTFIDGTEFDSSYSRHTPASFRVDGVINGWREALQLMPVGSKWQLFVPHWLAYGSKGAGKEIGPNKTLIFEVELLSIQEPKN